MNYVRFARMRRPPWTLYTLFRHSLKIGLKNLAGSFRWERMTWALSKWSLKVAQWRLNSLMDLKKWHGMQRQWIERIISFSNPEDYWILFYWQIGLRIRGEFGILINIQKQIDSTKSSGGLRMQILHALWIIPIIWGASENIHGPISEYSPTANPAIGRGQHGNF